MSKDLLQLVGFSNGMATIPCLLSLMCVLLERAEFEFERSEPFSTATMKRSSYYSSEDDTLIIHGAYLGCRFVQRGPTQSIVNQDKKSLPTLLRRKPTNTTRDTMYFIIIISQLMVTFEWWCVRTQQPQR
jgi:hypothetical protein